MALHHTNKLKDISLGSYTQLNVMRSERLYDIPLGSYNLFTASALRVVVISDLWPLDLKPALSVTRETGNFLINFGLSKVCYSYVRNEHRRDRQTHRQSAFWMLYGGLHNKSD